MNTKNKVVTLDETELIIFEALKANHGKPKIHIARDIVNSGMGSNLTPNAWDKRIDRFVDKYPQWNKPDFHVDGATTIQADYILKNRDLQTQIRELTTKLNTLTDEANKKIAHFTTIAKAIPRLPLVHDVPLIGKRSGVLREEQVVLLLSDAHINRIVDADQMEGFNEYNFDIFCNRYWFLLSEVIKIANAQRYDKKIEVLHIDCLGDMFNDIHREENMRTNQYSPVQAVLMGSYVLAQGLALLAPHFRKIVFTGIVGNEPRWDKTKPSKEKFNNMDYDAYHFMSLALMDYIEAGKIEFHIPVSPEIVVERMGKKFLLTHGDVIKSSLGFPAYGVNRDYNKQQELRRKRGGFDYMELGHFHQEYALAGKIFMNGSITGLDEYAKNELHVTGQPTQKLFGINEKYGVSWSYDIQLQHAKENDFVYDHKHIDTGGVGKVWAQFKKEKPELPVENTLLQLDIFNTTTHKGTKRELEKRAKKSRAK